MLGTPRDKIRLSRLPEVDASAGPGPLVDTSPSTPFGLDAQRVLRRRTAFTGQRASACRVWPTLQDSDAPSTVEDLATKTPFPSLSHPARRTQNAARIPWIATDSKPSRLANKRRPLRATTAQAPCTNWTKEDGTGRCQPRESSGRSQPNGWICLRSPLLRAYLSLSKGRNADGRYGGRSQRRSMRAFVIC